MRNKNKIRTTIWVSRDTIKLLKIWAVVTNKSVSKLIEELEVPTIIKDLVNLKQL